MRLRTGPQDLPAHFTFALIFIAIYLAQTILTARVLGADEEPVRSILSIGLQFVAVAIMLRVRNRSERTLQTLTALAIVGTVISLVAYPILLQSDPNVNQPMLGLIFLALFGWGLAVDANVFRHALNVSMPVGMLITVILLAMVTVITELVFR